MKRRIVCIWLGTFESEEELYSDYMSFNYDNEDNPQSKFGIDSGLGWYDEDFKESWWFKKNVLIQLEKYGNGILFSEYFFADFMKKLSSYDLGQKNTIIFLFGEEGGFNENLFQYKRLQPKKGLVEFFFSKEYEVEKE